MIGVITCEILELEFAHLLTQDRDIPAITVMSDRYSSGLIAALESKDFIKVSSEGKRAQMNPEDPSPMNIRTMVFEPDDFFDPKKMIQKLDQLILSWGQELIHHQHLEQIPESDEAWLNVLDRDIYWGDLNSQWEYYVVACLIFFVSLRADIHRDFLLQPDVIRGQRLSRWLEKLRRYQTPLSKDIITKFCLCYCMVMEKKSIKVRYRGLPVT